MIEKTLGYKVGQLFFPCIEDAQKHELQEIFADERYNKAAGYDPVEIAGLILQNQETVLDILTTTPTSKVRARKINGGTKRRKKKAGAEEIISGVQEIA